MEDPGLEEFQSKYFYSLQIKIIVTLMMVVQRFVGVNLILNYEKRVTWNDKDSGKVAQ